MQITRANIYSDICMQPTQTSDINAQFRFIKLRLIFAKQLRNRCVFKYILR